MPTNDHAHAMGTAQVVAGWIDLFVRGGVTHFFVAPGSRCTPLTLAIADHPETRVVQHFDERGLAFACLGYGRAAERPAVFVCTSGTAAANALPAVIEASYDHVPMLLLTADRPPELRDTGANQTIDQVKLYGQYPSWQFDLPCPTAEYRPEFWASCFQHAISAAQAGPVHLNCMFREPFEVCDGTPPLVLEANASESSIGLGYRQSRGHSPNGTVPTARTLPWTPPTGKTLVVCGQCRPAEAEAADRMARRLESPLLCDITTGRRSLFYDLQLMGPHPPAPDWVLHVGGRLTSKRLLSYLQERRPTQYWRLTEHPDRLDPLHLVSRVITGNLIELCDSCHLLNIDDTAEAVGRRGFIDRWQSDSTRAHTAVMQCLHTTNDLCEPVIASSIAELVPRGSAILLGNSMPVREFDTFADLQPEKAVRVFANRGASGIDGLVATAAGVAAGHPVPMTAVVGDLSLLHDLNSLSLVASCRAPFVVVVINNDGGGIFHFLPIAEQTRHFEQYFVTPHGRTFQHAAQLFGLDYRRPTTIEMFRNDYAQAIAQSGGRDAKRRAKTLIEVPVQRAHNHAIHRQIRDTVTVALKDRE